MDINPGLVMFVLHASKKYLLPGLTTKCTEFLSERTDPSNACTILDQSLLFNEPELAKKCLTIIKVHSKEAFSAESMVKISHSTLIKILDLEMFTVKEIHVFQSAVNWAKYQCKKNGVEPTGINMRKSLGKALYKIRFPDIENIDFANIVTKCEILNSAEVIALFCHLADKGSNEAPEQFIKQTRFLLGPFTVKSAERYQWAKVTDRVYNVAIECDSPIKIKKIIVGLSKQEMGHSQQGLGHAQQGLGHAQQGMVYAQQGMGYAQQGMGYAQQEVTSNIRAISYNGHNIGHKFQGKDGNSTIWQVEGDVIITSEPAFLKVTYSVKGEIMSMPKAATVMKDDLIKLKLSSDQSYIPIIGFEYMLE